MSRTDHENSNTVQEYAGKHDGERAVTVIDFAANYPGEKHE